MRFYIKNKEKIGFTVRRTRRQNLVQQSASFLGVFGRC